MKLILRPKSWMPFLLTTLLIIYLLKDLPHAGHDYFASAAKQWHESGNLGLPQPIGYLNELILTPRGWVNVFPPLPTLLMIPLTWLGRREVELAIVAGALSALAMYKLLIEYKITKTKAALVTLVYVLGSPWLYLISQEGSWYTAQLLAVLLAQLALISYKRQWHVLTGAYLGLALSTRLNLGFVLSGLILLRHVYRRDWSRLLQTVAGMIPGVLLVLWWNYYRFGDVLTTGYDLIPGVLNESWYSRGIMNVSYIWDNLMRYMWQKDTGGSGLGIIYANSYLLLLPVAWAGKYALPITAGILLFVIDLAHGNWGVVQFDFRYLHDSIWLLLIPLAFFSKWRLGLFAILATLSIAVHLNPTTMQSGF